MSKKTTIYDVASAAGVSIATVSRMLNAPDRVTAETRERIMAAIDSLGFVPKAEARARALRQNRRIGVITPFFTAPSFVQRLRGVAGEVSKSKYELVIYTVDSIERLKSYLASLPLTGNLDGLILLSLPVDEASAQRLLEHHLPTVLIEYPNPLLNSVEIDDIEGGRMAARYLINKGHRRIAFLGDTELPEYSLHPVSRRLIGFRQAMQDSGLEIPEAYICLVPYTQVEAEAAVSKLLSLPQPPTALFAATDFHALGALKAARQKNVNVPEQFAVIGFDDLDMAEYADLTTISQHLDESGRLAMEILLSRIADPERPMQHIHLSLNLIERLTA